MSNRIIDALENYITSDKSDPFTRNRVYSHTSRYLGRHNSGIGIASHLPNGEDALYSAERDKDAEGNTVYRNIRRP